MKYFMPVAMLGLLSVFVQAETLEWYGPEYRQCRLGSTAEIVQCLDRLTHAWRERVDRAYSALLRAQLDSSDRQDRLRQAQHLWIQYRDTNCAFYHARSGSISRIEAAECRRIMTARRALELEQSLRP